MPQVKVNLYATLRRYVDGSASMEVEIAAGSTVEQVLQRLGVPADQARVIFVDSRAASLADTLQGGEQVGVFPAIAGG